MLCPPPAWLLSAPSQATLKENSRTPVIESPLHIAASDADSASFTDAAPQGEPGMVGVGSSSMQHINSYIRAINFQLLEICRPEALILRVRAIQRGAALG